MADLIQRMADLKVRGTTCRAGYLVFSVIDFIQHARINTPTYETATRWFRAMDQRTYEEVMRPHIVTIKLPRGNSTYQTPCMSLVGLRMLFMCLHNEVEPEFEHAFQGIITQFMPTNA
jgi:hypothetical protein